MTAPALSELQRWMLTVMTAPGGVDDGIARAHAHFGLDAEGVVAAGYGPPPRQRLDIYAQGYLLRLLECLRADFPALRNTMGEALFDFFARAYILRHPSVSTTLFDLGAGFIPFLRATRPPGHDDPAFTLALDLATLERARTEAIRAEGLEGHTAPPPLDPLALLGPQPVRLACPATLRLLRLSYPLIGFLEAIERGEEAPPVPEPRPSRIAVSRIHYRVAMAELEAWQWAFLAAAQESDGELHECARQAAEESGEAMEKILARLMVWLPVAMGAGYLTVR